MSAAVQTQKPISQMPASARQLIGVKVTGSMRSAEQDIVAATGLQLGTPVNEDDFKRAARRLGDTGVFTDITYSYSYSSAGTKLAFHVVDADKFVPVRFEDFVWFSDADLLHRIKEHAPLFDGELPLSGRLPEEVSDVLQAMLVEKSIPGHVEYERVGKSDGPVQAILYRVADVLIQIRDVEFVGAGEAELPALTAASKRVFEREYSRTVLRSLIEKQLLPVYYSRGYLKASFGDPQPKVVKQPSASNDQGPRNLTIVDVSFPVTPGQQYKLKSLQWSGNEAIPTDTLAKMVRLEPGQAANMVRLGDSLSEIQKLYGSKGFVTVSITPQPSFDETAGSVAITLEVKEGPVFHMGDLEFRGLDNGLTAKLRNTWKIRPGEVYNSTYLSEYLPAAQRLLPPTLDWEVSPHVTANVKDQTVDVDLIYSAKAPK
ncbi:MAG: POTRA domain-containing protein [Candidatus Sulfotelmatobacter sp.]